MTQAEKEMTDSLLIADLWSNLRRIQLEIESRITPTLMRYDTPENAELVETLTAATDGIERYFLSYKLQVTPSTK